MLLNLSYYRVFGGRLQRRKVTLRNGKITVTFVTFYYIFTE